MRAIMFVSRYFRFHENGTSFRQETLAGVTTFLTMVYIILVNPTILSQAGMNAGGVFVATCLAAALGCFLMGMFSDFPVAVAPAMAINVYFTFVIVQGVGLDWQNAMGAVFIAALMFLLIVATKLREWIVSAIPESLNAAITVGLGLFIALVALKSAGIIVVEHKSFMSLGALDLRVLLFCIAFLIITILDFYKIPGSILIGMLIATALGLFFDVAQFHGVFSLPPSLGSTFMQMRFDHLGDLRGISIIFSLLFVSLFDCTGTLLGLMQHAKLANKRNQVKRISQGLVANSMASVVGAVLGTTSPSPYLESASGIRAGGRTGFTALVVAVLFLCALFLAPLASTIPEFATAPALLFVACLMIRNVLDIPFDDVTELIPAALTAIIIPFTLSVANGVGLGIISYTVIKMLTKKPEDLNSTLIVLSLLFIFYFIMQATVVAL